MGDSLPWGLIGTIGLILGVEKAVAWYDADLTGTVALNWRHARYAAVSRAPGCEILCLGSSMVKLGIGARIIGAETGKPTYNLAMSAASLPANYFVLRRALKAGARPRAVLIDCLDNGTEPFQLHNNLRNYPELLNRRETFDIAWHTGDTDFLAMMLLSRWLPSLKTRFEIRNNALAALRGVSASLKTEGFLARRNWEANGGTSVMPRNLEFEAIHRDESVQTVSQAPARAGGATRLLSGTYTQRFLDLTAAHGIRVYYVLPPLPPHTQKDWIRSGADQKRVNDASEFQAHYPDLVVLDARCSGYPVTAFIDDVHLNATGASVLSGDVAAIMKQSWSGTGAPRAWVTLPAYHEPVPALRLEDVSQTRLALKAARRRRR
jgi:hypothetical protein